MIVLAQSGAFTQNLAMKKINMSNVKEVDHVQMDHFPYLYEFARGWGPRWSQRTADRQKAQSYMAIDEQPSRPVEVGRYHVPSAKRLHIFGKTIGKWWFNGVEVWFNGILWDLPSGKRVQNHGKSPF